MIYQLRLGWGCIMVILISLLPIWYFFIKGRSLLETGFDSCIDLAQAPCEPVVDALVDVSVNGVLMISVLR